MNISKFFGLALVALLAVGLAAADADAGKKKKKSEQELENIVCQDSEVLKYDVASSRWICAADLDTVDTDWNHLTNVPAGFSDGIDNDALGGLTCDDGEIAKWNSGAWECAAAGGDVGKKYVFMTSKTFNGDLKTAGNGLSGLTGADALCQDAAENGIVPPGKYVAWLSTSTKDAKDRLVDSPDGWYLPDGVTKIADDLADLTSGSIQNFIGQDEKGVAISGESVWTGTAPNGSAGNNPGDCNSWTAASASVHAKTGLNGNASSSWTDVFNDFLPPLGPCDGLRRLYCFSR